jgi:hypothetical protein
VAASVADEVALESPNKFGGILFGIIVCVVVVVGIVDNIVEFEMFTGSFSIVFTGGLVEIEIFSGGS